MEKIIRVTGEGKGSVKPDTIVVSLQLMGQNKKYEKALEELDKKVYVVRAEMEKLGIDDVKTQNFSVSPEYKRVYGRNNNYDDVFEGYKASHSLNISFAFDTEKLGDVISALTGTLAEPRLSISFKAKKLDGVKAEILKDAVVKAREDAQALAEAAGVKLGDILSINHSFSEVQYSYPRRADFMAKECAYEEASIGSSLRGISVEDINLEANVTIEWQIN